MQINITTSLENKDVVRELSRRLNLGSENHIARIALAYSLKTNIKLSIQHNLQDSKGKAYKEDTFFGKYKTYYIAMICQFYNLHKSNSDISKYIKMHVDHGLELINKIFNDNKNYSGFDFLIDNIDSGINALENTSVSLEHVNNYNQNIEKTFSYNPWKLLVGKDENGNDIFFTPNNTIDYSNSHIAVAGKSGVGKTYFAQRLLERIIEASEYKTNFIFLDFKGISELDKQSKEFSSFFKKTQAELIDTPNKPFPVNPLSFIDSVNENNKILGINKFVDIVTDYAGLGKVQVQHLKEATKIAFDNQHSGKYPTLKEILNNVHDIAGDRPTTLTEILVGLSEVELFDTNSDGSFLNNNYYLSLSGDLSKNVRFTAAFLIINYIYNTFMNMENTQIENDIKGMRYVLLIDEAHNVFKDKKSKEILEKILREIRSKGVSVVLLSQGIEEFNQPSFDFSSMCETAFLLDINNKNDLRMINKFLGFSDKESNKVARSMEKIKSRQAISNIKEYERAKIFNII
ncbi:MAG: DNA sulfur modification protein DndE [Bacteroidetes bacterium GWF2_33_16]|nr:MAG: DNA sulfur modification protein DndE [Bacteroidetes bacterium GWE2_32_14]OFY02302.1 MAG: DNA sulfur modification protein DndE [Bacteroidetes bacterium GWF2_33_16]